MFQYEANRAKIQAEIAQRQEEERVREAMRRKQQEKREKLLAEERRLQELQKIAMEGADYLLIARIVTASKRPRKRSAVDFSKNHLKGSSRSKQLER